MTESIQRYHHGDLQATLLQAATQRLETHGIDGLSLRKLAEDLGVSRTAPYHHFKDKNALLSAIAAQGFAQWHDVAKQIFEQHEVPAAKRLRVFIKNYIGFAAANPQMYELMFGRTLWQQGAASEDLKNVAYPSFQYQVEMTRMWQQHELLPKEQDPVRLAQVTWGTLHGIARLLIDGIYADSSHIEEMCDCAAALFIQHKTDC
ncbi:TetR/AcrR family transcriptional regulator [Alteromonas aestuariivivens]|uniref:TetR/AcrR family transcriptional regulator n=1 Tax=Alteromonas aestuariivivens TaxID=1938339 RepID=A0A3D8M4N8_9ALTE|nr:TetR/AcrR family transcriptional regulator [Alteromonas aestuariivivens]RDV24626.1 TetR/AcrR family transcriptional regulator [Alteromonas aestuariivivens]